MRKMKKSRILWLAVWLCLALSGCAKTESASEIMAKVQAKQMESEAVQSVAMNGQLKMTTQGMTLEFPMDLVIQTQPAEKQGEPVVYFSFTTSFMGQSMDMKYCVQDQMMYSEVNGERSSQPYAYTPETIQELQQNRNMEKMVNAFSVKKTGTGYELIYEAQSFAELADLLGALGDAEPDLDALQELQRQFETIDQTVTLNQWKMSFQISKDYQMTGGLIAIDATSEAEGTTMNFGIEINVSVRTDQPMTTIDTVSLGNVKSKGARPDKKKLRRGV